MKGLLKRAGLVGVSCDTSFPLEFLLLTGIDCYIDSAFQKQVAPMVSGFEKAWLTSGQEEFLAALYENMAAPGLGRSVVIYAQRK